jgi:hypothetical protein
MADTVRYLMEEMLPELEDMRRKRYFSKAELKEVVRRRQEFEYQLKRKAALKEDFLRQVPREQAVAAACKAWRKVAQDPVPLQQCWVAPVHCVPCRQGSAGNASTRRTVHA